MNVLFLSCSPSDCSRTSGRQAGKKAAAERQAGRRVRQAGGQVGSHVVVRQPVAHRRELLVLGLRDGRDLDHDGVQQRLVHK